MRGGGLRRCSRRSMWPVLGIVENMSYFQCPPLRYAFGHLRPRRSAARGGAGLPLPFFGRDFRCNMSIRVTSDSGTPVVEEASPMAPHAAIYRAIGAKVRDQLQGVIAAGLKPLFPGGMRLSFNQCCHAFVAFFATELPCLKRRPERLSADAKNRFAENNASRKSGETPQQGRCPEMKRRDFLKVSATGAAVAAGGIAGDRAILARDQVAVDVELPESPLDTIYGGAVELFEVRLPK